MIFNIIILVLKLFWIWPMGAPSGWLLCLCDMPWVLFFLMAAFLIISSVITEVKKVQADFKKSKFYLKELQAALLLLELYCL